MQTKQEIVVKKLQERGVTIRDISQIVIALQQKYIPLTLEQCDTVVLEVIRKREPYHAILTGIAIDEMAEKEMLDKDINNIIVEDNHLYGVDEILALSIVNMHGSIALTNFGYLDKTKPGIIYKLDKLGKEKKGCHTFLDDIVAAIAASAASILAHSIKG